MSSSAPSVGQKRSAASAALVESDRDVLQFTPLGGGCEVGRSCHLLQFKGRTLMLDCGLHPAYSGIASLPYFDEVDPASIDIILITHFHLDHAAALPYFLTKTAFKGRVFMTHPTKSVYKLILQDYVKVSSISVEETLYTEADLLQSMERIECVNYHQVVQHEGVKLWAYNAGHVLGAAMFMIEIGGVRVLYTGDYSRTEDRHLMAAELPLPSLYPHILIVEATYGTQTLRPVEEREQRFCSLVQEIVEDRGGSCLIPVFALGRAQELLLILDEYWEAHPSLQSIPIYYASFLARKCMPESDTRVLTDAGFLFLDQIEALMEERRKEGKELLFACLERNKLQPKNDEDVMKGKIVYCKGELQFPHEPSAEVPFPPPPPSELLTFTSGGEAQRWTEGSGPYGKGVEEAEEDAEELAVDDADIENVAALDDEDADEVSEGIARIRSRHVSLRVTPDHDMYVQLGLRHPSGIAHWSSTGRSNENPIVEPHARTPASSLLCPCDCPPVQADEVDCLHRRRLMRMLACADAGRTPSAEEIAFVRVHVQRRLKLSDAQFIAFLEFFGFWVGDGALQYGRSGNTRPDAVTCARVQDDDVNFLRQMAVKLGLTSSQYRFRTYDLRRARKPSKTVTVIEIIDPLWFAFFDEEFGLQYKYSLYYDPKAAIARQGNISKVKRSSVSAASTTRSISSTSSPPSPSVSDADSPKEEEPDSPVEEESPTVLDPPTEEELPPEDDPDTPLDPDLPTKSCKWLPSWVIMCLTPAELFLVIHGLWRASGAWSGQVPAIYTCGVALRDQCMQALLHCGFSAFSRHLYGAGTIRGWQWHSQRVDKTVYTVAEVRAMSEVEQAMYKPIRATTDCWAVEWAEPTSPAGQTSCWPTMLRHKAITPEPYSRDRDGRIWCVTVEHNEHVIIAQRAHRTADGQVTKQSRPIAVGQCMMVYQTYLNMMNAHIQRQAQVRNPFHFKHVLNLKNLNDFDDSTPCVILASPGMLQNGVSRDLLELWCSDEKNGVIIAGYAVEGTLAKFIMTEPTHITSVAGARLPLRMSVNYVSFSAHADYRETSEFIDTLRPAHTILVHGDVNEGVGKLKAALVDRYGATMNCQGPKNGQTVELEFKQTKIVKTVGKLAEGEEGKNGEKVAEGVKDGRVMKGVIVRKDFVYQFMAVEDLPNFTPIQCTAIKQTLIIPFHQTFACLHAFISQLFVPDEDYEESDDDDEADAAAEGGKAEKGEKAERPPTIRIHRTVVGRWYVGRVELEWDSSPVDDMVADSVVSLLTSVQATVGGAKLVGVSHQHGAHKQSRQPPSPRSSPSPTPSDPLPTPNSPTAVKSDDGVKAELPLPTAVKKEEGVDDSSEIPSPALDSLASPSSPESPVSPPRPLSPSLLRALAGQYGELVEGGKGWVVEVDGGTAVVDGETLDVEGDDDVLVKRVRASVVRWEGTKRGGVDDRWVGEAPRWRMEELEARLKEGLGDPSAAVLGL